MRASETLWNSNAFMPSSARAVRPSAASAQSRRVKRSARAAEASAIAPEPRILTLLQASCLRQEQMLLLQRSFESRAPVLRGRPCFSRLCKVGSHLQPCMCRLRRRNSLVPLVAIPRLSNTCRPEKSVVLRRPTVAYQANHSVKRTALRPPLTSNVRRRNTCQIR